ncbi:alternate F1F0 ATPase, F1 subunit alpha [Agriterribacter sp.]|uniref:alternate F1F0 ATPase, F1 subunit alpha n=1 Tax=Agriterribacter sp. TaxID=2821509 RepID=UPI002C1F8CD8|nr:alternate F1F0 ATPase, F1 subunit alpha [Agriterribacter sp.]HRP57291.1 alternate F1F0 ATPase, F1 subunit alpha [Agriterribacter sp.]
MVKETNLQDNVDRVFEIFRKSVNTLSASLAPRETGEVKSIHSGIARISGLPGVGYQELVRFPSDIYGIAMDLKEDEVGVVLLGDDALLKAGDDVKRTGRTLDVPVGEALLGRVINPIGNPVDGKAAIAYAERLPVERPAPAIMHRAPINKPLQTGIKVVDAMIPIGRGQRELILGDRQTGKTAIGIDTILNQRGKDVICVYCAIGQRAAAVAQTIARLEEHEAMNYTVVVVTDGNDPAGLQYIAPYAATSIAEYFMERGRDVLIVYDDLTKHARAYREMSLLLQRPPGREAFPGDIFYLHSRLLERSTHLNDERGGGSLTALPIVETEAQNMSAYIPTNLISITDGQLYLSPKLFGLGILPAVDVGRSVSRVGGKAQWKVFRKLAGTLKLTYAQFEELESFARFGARLDEDTRKRMEHGRRIRLSLIQSELHPLSAGAQVLVLLALKHHLMDKIPEENMQEAQDELYTAADSLPGNLTARVFEQGDLNAEDEEALLERVRFVLDKFLLHKTTDISI